MPKQVSVSRMVHFVMPNGQHRPAVVVHVNEDGTPNLQVFTDAIDNHANVILKQRVQEGTEAHTWHWPEQVPAPAEAPGPASPPELTGPRPVG